MSEYPVILTIRYHLLKIIKGLSDVFYELLYRFCYILAWEKFTESCLAIPLFCYIAW
jgi:hypothetical protein